MFVWTDKKIEWYERAVAENHFPENLAEILKVFLSKDTEILELGCGTGDLSLELYRQEYDVTACDIDKLAVSYFKHKCEACQYDMQVECADWSELISFRQWDTVLMCFAGDFRRDADLYLKGCKRQIIFVTQEPCKDHAYINEDNTSHIEYRLFENEMKELLDMKCIRYTVTDAELEAGQPFKDPDEMLEYMDAYKKPQAFIEKSKKALIKRDDIDQLYPYYLPKNKRIKIYRIIKQQ